MCCGGYGGGQHVHQEETDLRGLYVAQVAFVRPGIWGGLEVLATPDHGPLEVVRLTVPVLTASHTPAHCMNSVRLQGYT